MLPSNEPAERRPPVCSGSAWLTIAEADPDGYANWSPDGKTLYFTLEEMDTLACGASESATEGEHAVTFRQENL